MACYGGGIALFTGMFKNEYSHQCYTTWDCSVHSLVILLCIMNISEARVPYLQTAQNASILQGELAYAGAGEG
jgi:hypothetical protein